MASTVIRPVDRRIIDLTGLATGGSATIFLARRIDCAPYRELTAYVRSHPGTSVATAPTVCEISINADGYTEEDPGALDASNRPAFQQQIDSIAINTGFAAGVMKTKSPTVGFGLVSLSMNVTAGNAGALRYVISIDLVLKEF